MDPSFTGVVTSRFFEETLGGVFTRLISRNTTIPTKKSQAWSRELDADGLGKFDHDLTDLPHWKSWLGLGKSSPNGLKIQVSELL